MQVLILRLLSMFLWCPGVPALESELTKFLCSVSSLHEAVHHKSDASLWAVLSSAAEDAATWWSWCAWVPCTSWWPCCHQLCSFSVFVVGVATGQCSWSCSSLNHPGGIADTIGPQLEDLQHCCLGKWCLKIQLGEVSEESVVHLFDFIRMASSCGSYYINVLGWPKYLGAPLSLPSVAECTDSTSIQVCPFSRNFWKTVFLRLTAKWMRALDRVTLRFW